MIVVKVEFFIPCKLYIAKKTHTHIHSTEFSFNIEMNTRELRFYE